MVVPAPTFVKLNPPLMVLLKVPEPAPPIELFAPKAIKLFKVELVPEKVSAPVLLSPVPRNVMPLVLPSVALLKLISKAAPLVIEMPLELLSALLAAKLKVPAEIFVAPK